MTAAPYDRRPTLLVPGVPPYPPAVLLRRLVLAAAVTTGAVLAVAGQAVAGAGTVGSWSGGDPYFPHAGNGGYDVADYDLALRYEPATRALAGVATITMTPTTDLAGFTLDLWDLTVRSVTVDGRPAAYVKEPRELRVTPPAVLPPGRAVRVQVVYDGTAKRPHDSGGALYGFVATPDGALVANEPNGAPTWYPVDDRPTDKATYTVSVDVPLGKTAVSNGDLVSFPSAAGRTVWTWREAQPMASYLATATIGDFDLSVTSTPSGLREIDAVDRDLSAADRARAQRSLALQARVVALFEEHFGPYPFTSVGGIVDDDTSIGYALETQTRPVYSGAPGEVEVAHELAHQWFGDSTTLSQWRDIWLNEGFATYGEWLWQQSRGGPTLQQQWQREYVERPADDPLWRVAPHDPGAADLFDDAVYVRGALTLYALKQQVGDAAFGTILRRWSVEHRDGNVTTADLVRLASSVSGRDLTAFFTAWLDRPGKPPLRP